MKDTETITKSQTTAVAKFTASKRSEGLLRRDVERLFAQKKITPKDIEDFTKPQRQYLAETCSKMLQELKGAARDNFIEQTALIIPASTNSDIWEYNHWVISEAVSKLMREHGVMPTKNAIAHTTGLTRQTVAKHFNEYKKRPETTEEMEQFKFMAPKLLANVFKVALNGDMRAARLYFEMVGAINKPQAGGVVNNQNNYIQINNTILSQENLKQLTAEQLNQIESIVNTQCKILA